MSVKKPHMDDDYDFEMPAEEETDDLEMLEMEEEEDERSLGNVAPSGIPIPPREPKPAELPLSEEPEKTSKKTAFLAAGCAACAAFGLFGIYAMFFNHSAAPELETKQDVFTYEYGDPVSLDPSVYLKKGADDAHLESPGLFRKYGTKTDGQNNLTPEKDEKIQPGEYDCFVTATNTDGAVALASFVIQVEDTKAPEWDKTESTLTFNEGELKTLDLSRYFSATDASDVSIHADGDYSLSVAGTYMLSVYAEDAYGNRSQSTKSLTLNIKHVDSEEDKAVAEKLAKYDEMTNEIDRLRTSLEDSNSKTEKLEKELDESAGEITKLEKDLDDKDKELESLKKDLDDANKALEDARSQTAPTVPSSPTVPSTDPSGSEGQTGTQTPVQQGQ